MTEPPRHDVPEPTQPFGAGYPAYPAYAGQSPFGPADAGQSPFGPAGAGQSPHGPAPAAPWSSAPAYPGPSPDAGYQNPTPPPPTQPIPAYPAYGYDYATGLYGAAPPPAGPPQQPPNKSRRWLWVVAGLSVLLAIGLVIALVIVNSNKQETVVAPLTPTSTAPSRPPSTTRTPTPQFPLPLPRIPGIPGFPAPSNSPPPSGSTPATGTDTVVYEVNGDGRAINITYIDNGNLLQTEFNVMLPWRREVSLPTPAADSASVTVINFGHSVTCTVTVNGAVIRQRSGTGLTTCSASA
jgi:hypothetical protein